jgi:HAD superfamily hydrolase (TIGR01509 family)
MSKIKAVVFDLNGVFVKSLPLSERLAEKTGRSIEEILSVMKPILKEIRNVERRGSEVWQPLLDLLGMSFEEFFDFYQNGESVDFGMIDFAKDLKNKGLLLFFLSNNFRERIEYYRANFPELFEFTNKAYFSWETGFVKPDPNAYLNLLKENDLAGNECLYIDDSQENLDAAAGFWIVGIKYESTEQVVEEVEELI